MKDKRVQPAVTGEVTLAGSFEANGGNLGDCRNQPYNRMLERYKKLYGDRYTDHELERMHRRWKQLAASV